MWDRGDSQFPPFKSLTRTSSRNEIPRSYPRVSPKTYWSGFRYNTIGNPSPKPGPLHRMPTSLPSTKDLLTHPKIHGCWCLNGIRMPHISDSNILNLSDVRSWGFTIPPLKSLTSLSRSKRTKIIPSSDYNFGWGSALIPFVMIQALLKNLALPKAHGFDVLRW